MSRAAWWGNVAGVGVVVALVVGLVLTQRSAPEASRAPGPAANGGAVATSVEPGDLTGARAAADLAPCPQAEGAGGSDGGGSGGGAGPLAGLTLDCLGDGTSVPVAAALAGRPAVLDVWAWNCAPCADELPALAEYAERAGDAVQVLTVHSSPATGNGLERLAAYGVRLPGVADPTSRLAALVGAPQVLPVTVLLRADGSVAKILAKPYTSPEEIAADVELHLGVSA